MSIDHQVYGGGRWNTAIAAVNHTKGVVMLYNDRPINALFHSDVYTEDSVNVWGNDIRTWKVLQDFQIAIYASIDWYPQAVAL